MKDFAIVGSGIGGSGAAAVLASRGYDVTLLEKEPYLGGCSSTFTYRGQRYNTGATTFAGYQEGRPVKALFDAAGATPPLQETDPALVVVQGEHTIRRYRDLERFIEEINAAYPHPKNRAFWELVHRICQEFYQLEGYYYSDASLWRKGVSLASFFPLTLNFRGYIIGSARTFITDFFGTISPEYLAFLDAQLMITTQARTDAVHFLAAALGLGYTFEANHYVTGGMGRLFDALTASVESIETANPVRLIQRLKDRYVVETRKGTVEARRLILNTTIFDSARLFDDAEVSRYYGRFTDLQNYQSAFLLYATIRTDRKLEHHYQLLDSDLLPDTLSPAIFVSFSDPDDREMTLKGYYSMTASIHTDLRWWNRNDAEYKARKSALQEQMMARICATLGIAKESIVTLFSGTPATFGRYIGRTQLGGHAVTRSNLIFRLPANDTPIPGLYHVGDTAYAAQGWPGVAMGVQNLDRLLHG